MSLKVIVTFGNNISTKYNDVRRVRITDADLVIFSSCDHKSPITYSLSDIQTFDVTSDVDQYA